VTEQQHFIDRLAMRRSIPREELEFVDYGRAIRHTETKKVLAHRNHEGWIEVGTDEDRLEG
jgi:hypothetical protein